MMSAYKTYGIKDGKNVFQKFIIILLNASTLWQCKRCKEKRPHGWLSGKRLAYWQNDTCTFCKDLIEIDKEYEDAKARLKKSQEEYVRLLEKL